MAAASVTRVPLETRAGATRDTPPYLSALEERERDAVGGKRNKRFPLSSLKHLGVGGIWESGELKRKVDELCTSFTNAILIPLRNNFCSFFFFFFFLSLLSSSSPSSSCLGESNPTPTKSNVSYSALLKLSRGPVVCLFDVFYLKFVLESEGKLMWSKRTLFFPTSASSLREERET